MLFYFSWWNKVHFLFFLILIFCCCCCDKCDTALKAIVCWRWGVGCHGSWGVWPQDGSVYLLLIYVSLSTGLWAWAHLLLFPLYYFSCEPSVSFYFSPLFCATFPHTFLSFSSHSFIQSWTDCQPLYIVSRNYKTPPPCNSESSSFFMQALRLILFSKVSDIWGEKKCFDHFPDLWWSFLGTYVISILC